MAKQKQKIEIYIWKCFIEIVVNLTYQGNYYSDKQDKEEEFKKNNASSKFIS